MLQSDHVVSQRLTDLTFKVSIHHFEESGHHFTVWLFAALLLTPLWEKCGEKHVSSGFYGVQGFDSISALLSFYFQVFYN